MRSKIWEAASGNLIFISVWARASGVKKNAILTAKSYFTAFFMFDFWNFCSYLSYVTIVYLIASGVTSSPKLNFI